MAAVVVLVLVTIAVAALGLTLAVPLSPFDEHDLGLVCHAGNASLDVLLVSEIATLQRRDCVLLRDNLKVVVELVHEGGAWGDLRFCSAAVVAVLSCFRSVRGFQKTPNARVRGRNNRLKQRTGEARETDER